ncbi:hypothetical protein CbC4_5019 (plasmid) [Clostridium botulinum BKT015925]|nr:hypothetical protein CbC4_5019 [Clostridium botulinum BKT015925]KEH96034.1 hypothetical protein Y848_p0019 [Clostridium botulinum C/D str. Sp77]
MFYEKQFQILTLCKKISNLILDKLENEFLMKNKIFTYFIEFKVKHVAPKVQN